MTEKQHNSFADWPALMQTRDQAHVPVIRSPQLLRNGPMNVPKGVEFVWSEEERYLYLARLRVPAEHRGKGIATALLAQLKDRARASHKGIRLSFRPDTGEEDNVRRWYKKRGFRFLSDLETMIWKP